MRWVAALFFAFVALIVLAADMGWAEPVFAFIKRFPLSDKIFHFVLVGGLNFFLILAWDWPRSPNRRRIALRISLLIFAASTLEEASQLYFHNRTFDFRDMLANWLGIAVLGFLAGVGWKERCSAPVDETLKD